MGQQFSFCDLTSFLLKTVLTYSKIRTSELVRTPIPWHQWTGTLSTPHSAAGPGLANCCYEGLDSKYFRSWRLHSLWSNYSTLSLVHKSSHKWKMNEFVWPYSNRTLFINIDFHINFQVLKYAFLTIKNCKQNSELTGHEKQAVGGTGPTGWSWLSLYVFYVI